MTRKDFEAIAAAMKSIRPPNALTSEYTLWHRAVHEMCVVCARHNSLFDYNKFRAACGV